MYQIDFNHPVHVHFVGIGGISMSGLAQILASEGCTVSGSDRAASEITRTLENSGIRVMIGQRRENITKDIDPILAGMAALNMRGDTDLVTDVVERMLATKQIRLGTHASQSLANFCMFTAKDSDVFLRRFGKYINLETARVYNEGQSRGKRKNDILTLNEYITGVYDEYDENGNLVPNSGKSKLSLSQLFEGTPLDKIERTYYDNLATRVRNAYIDKNAEGEPDPAAIEAFKAKMGQIETAVAPAFISAMLKYASGSEQIVNAAADLTGLKKGKDGDGTAV